MSTYPINKAEYEKIKNLIENKIKTVVFQRGRWEKYINLETASCLSLDDSYTILYLTNKDEENKYYITNFGINLLTGLGYDEYRKFLNF